MRQVCYDIQAILDELRSAIRFEDKVRSQRELCEQVADLIKIASGYHQELFCDFLKNNRYRSPRVIRELSYVYTLLTDEVKQLLPASHRYQCVGVYLHAVRPEVTIVYVHVSPDSNLRRWVEQRSEDHPLPLEAKKVIDEFFREHPEHLLDGQI